MVHFFQFYDNELHYVGYIPWWRDQLRFDGDSYVLGAFRLSILQTWFASAAWRYADGQLQFIEQDFYHALPVDTLWDYVAREELEHYSAAQDMYVYTSKNPDAEPLILREGTEFDLLGTDNVEWVLLQTMSGEQYWIYCEASGIKTPQGYESYLGYVIRGLSYAD